MLEIDLDNVEVEQMLEDIEDAMKLDEIPEVPSSAEQMFNFHEKQESNMKAIGYLIDPIAKYFKSDYEEIFINEFKKVNVKTKDGKVEYFVDEELSKDYLDLLQHVIANTRNQSYSSISSDVSQHKISVMLPWELYRFTGIIGTSFDSGISISIRLNTFDSNITLEDFELSQAEIKFLQKVIQEQGNIIISGATGSGKTTFTNNLIKDIDKDERTLLIGDLYDYDLRNIRNVLMYYFSSDSSDIAEKTINEIARRVTSSRILFSELIPSNANLILNLSQISKGCLFTMHATEIEGIEKIFLNFLPERSAEYIKSTLEYFDLMIITEKKKNNKRVLRSIKVNNKEYLEEICEKNLFQNQLVLDHKQKSFKAKKPKIGNIKKPINTELEENIIAEYQVSNCSMKELAKKHNSTEYSVRKILMSNGIKLAKVGRQSLEIPNDLIESLAKRHFLQSEKVGDLHKEIQQKYPEYSLSYTSLYTKVKDKENVVYEK